MLILTRRKGETIIIGKNGEITLAVLSTENGVVKLGISAPTEIPVHREEIYLKIRQQKYSGKRSQKKDK